MINKARNSIKLVAISTAVILLCGYVYVQVRDVLGGPSILVRSPTENPAQNSFTYVEGKVDNIAWVSINDRSVFVDQNGYFREPQVLLPGYNLITIKAEDRYGKRNEKQLQLYYQKDSKLTILKK